MGWASRANAVGHGRKLQALQVYRKDLLTARALQALAARYRRGALTDQDRATILQMGARTKAHLGITD